MLNRKHLAVEENACVNEAGCIKWFLCSRRVKKCRIRTSLLLLLCFFFFHCLLFTFLCVLCPFVAFFCLRVFLGGSVFNLSGSFFKLCHRTKQRTAYCRLIRSGVLLDILHTKLYAIQQCAFSSNNFTNSSYIPNRQWKT